MHNSLRGLLATLIVLWIVLCIAASIYSHDKNIPGWVTVAVLPAFLVEAALYVASGTPAVLERLKTPPPRNVSAGLLVCAVTPYILYSAGTGVFRLPALLTILAMAAVASFWYLVWPRSAWADAAYLAFLAIPILFKVFPVLYIDPVPKLQIFILAVLMWYRTAIVSVLVVRRMEGVGFGFIPHRREWRIGFRNYLYFIPLGIGGGLLLNFIRLRPDVLTLRTLGLAVATFFGVLWVLATAEEFFFRGILQQLLSRGLRSQVLGLILTSLVFGAVHLGYRNFPNYSFAALATVAGLFYGMSYIQAGGIRAAMVTHALVVTTWRVFFY